MTNLLTFFINNKKIFIYVFFAFVLFCFGFKVGSGVVQKKFDKYKETILNDKINQDKIYQDKVKSILEQANIQKQKDNKINEDLNTQLKLSKDNYLKVSKELNEIIIKDESIKNCSMSDDTFNKLNEVFK